MGRLIAAAIFLVAGTGIGGLLILEAIALLYNTHSTISDIISGEIAAHGPAWGFVIGFICGGIVMLLVGHFADVWRWWQP